MPSPFATKTSSVEKRTNGTAADNNNKVNNIFVRAVSIKTHT